MYINAFYAQLIMVLKIPHSIRQCILYADNYGIYKTMHVVLQCVLYTGNYELRKNWISYTAIYGNDYWPS